MMKQRLQNSACVIATLCLMLAAGIFTTAGAQALTASDPLAALPASDGVMFIDMNRIVTQAMPRVLAGNPARLAAVNADLERFRQRTGVDPRWIDRIAIGTSYTTPSAGVTKLNTIAIARGRFNAGTIVAAGRLAAKGKYAVQKHAGRTIYVFTLEEQLKMFGLLKMNVGELAISELDANTLALGKPDAVRAAVDAAVDAAGARRSVAPNAALIALANRIPNALVGFGGNIPANLLTNVDLGNPEVNRSLASVRQIFGSLGMNGSGYEMLTTARTTDARAAKSLNETVDAARGLASLVVGNLQGGRGRLARGALENLRVTVENADVSLRVTIPEADIAALVSGL